MRQAAIWPKLPNGCAAPRKASAGSQRSAIAGRPGPRYTASIMLDRASNIPDLPAEIARRRTFAIISHPDAGKTTLTEKFLLYGGAIQMAGQVRAKGEARRTRSDFMQMEKDRGISVSASAMSFDYGNYRFNLVDTPGHSDFSEDTYRTLTAVDAAVMVIDGAKGVESQTRKLFEVCRLRDLPILTFCNKMDRESRDTFEIIDEIQENLAIDVTPASWPIGVGREFIGCYDMLHDRLELMDRADRNKRGGIDQDRGARRPEARRARARAPARKAARRGRDGARTAARLRPAGVPRRHHDADLVRLRDQLFRRQGTDGRHRRLRPRAAAADAPSRARSRPREDQVVGLRLQGAGQHGPQAPRPRGLRPPRLGPFRARHETAPTCARRSRWRSPTRCCSSPPTANWPRRPGPATSSASRTTASLRIGDTLTEGEALRVTGIPSFAPELLQNGARDATR